MSKIGFQFPRDDSQQWDGFNEPGVAHFSGSPFRSLGREGTQNSIDATKGPSSRIRIRRIEVPTNSIPDVAGLKAAVQRCKLEAANEGEKALQFFHDAEILLEKPKVSILQFADHNTRGVRGPCENGTPYFALMKATGQSKKETATATGSFGIGKFAPYTVSGLRTTFLTTVWADGEANLHHYVQGKAILMSSTSEGQTLRGTGFWGVKANCQPLVGKKDLLPDWLRREDMDEDSTGTTLSILGFQAVKGWESILAASIAESFFGAICRGALQVDIEDGPVLDRDTLPAVFANQAIVEAIKDQKEEPETFLNSGHFLHALNSPESLVEDTQNATLGHCRLHILVAEGMPKRVAVLRNGMLITSELPRLRRFGEFKEFVAVVECLSDKGNELLRAMEPPAHDEFEPALLSTTSMQRSGRIALRELADWVREMLRRHAQDPVDEVTEIDELAEFFGDDESEGGSGDKNGDENPRGSLKVRARPLPRKKSATTTSDLGDAVGDDGDGDGDGSGDDEGDAEGSEGGEGGGGGSNDSEGGDRSSGGAGGGGKSTPVATLSLRNVRAVVIGPKRRRIAFTPHTTGHIKVELEDSGADTNRLLKVTASSVGEVVDGRVRIGCSTNDRVIVEVELERNFEGTIRVKANAI